MAAAGASATDVDLALQRLRFAADPLQHVQYLHGGRDRNHFQAATRGIQGDACVRIEWAQRGGERGRVEIGRGQFELHLMEQRKITVLCELGTGEDAGLYRASFYHEGKRVRLVVDREGNPVGEQDSVMPGSR